MYNFCECSIDEFNLYKSISQYEIFGSDAFDGLSLITLNENKIGLLKKSFYQSSPLLEWFEIFPEFQGKGHGQNAVKSIISEFREKSNSQSLFIVPLDEDIEKFWEKCGFVHCSNSQMMFYPLRAL